MTMTETFSSTSIQPCISHRGMTFIIFKYTTKVSNPNMAHIYNDTRLLSLPKLQLAHDQRPHCASVPLNTQITVPPRTFLKADMLAQPDLLPYLRHGFRLFDLPPVPQEIGHLNLPHVLVRRAEPGEHLGRDIRRRQL